MHKSIHRFYRCATPPGSPLWEAHFDELCYLHSYALAQKKPGLAGMAADLIEGHLHQQQEYERAQLADQAIRA